MCTSVRDLDGGLERLVKMYECVEMYFWCVRDAPGESLRTFYSAWHICGSDVSIGNYLCSMQLRKVRRGLLNT
jgi:hypothetical protein